MRAAVVVLDAVGAGALPDAADYGDAGADTLVHLAEAVGGLELPTLGGLGLGNIRPLAGVDPVPDAPAAWGRVHPLGPGKDSTSGHWELMGVVTPEPLPTYPEGFPPEVMAILEDVAGRGFLLNRPYDGVSAIQDAGEEHLRTGKLILYTSQDSVLQIAGHVDVLPEDELVGVCARVREALPPEHRVGRVIARPFAGPPGAFARTEGRRDFSVVPPGPSYLQAIGAAGHPVHGVGKIHDLFAGIGVDVKHPGATNAAAIGATTRLLTELEEGLVFVNLVETDQVYGHRKDVEGFHAALRAIDAAVATWLALLRPGDLLILSSDHGVDPAMPHSDHTREHGLLLATGARVPPGRHEGPMADVGATAYDALVGGAVEGLPGRSLLTAG